MSFTEVKTSVRNDHENFNPWMYWDRTLQQTWDTHLS